MAVIDQFRADDRSAIDALYRRVFGRDMAEASRLRWEWQYGRNPNSPRTGPQIWIAREGPAIVGQYATMPVRLLVAGTEVDASWGMDVMVAPERQRQGLGEVLFGTWDRSVGASLGLGLSKASTRLFEKLRWPNVGPVPCLIKPLTRRALRRPEWPAAVNRLVSAATVPLVAVLSRTGTIPDEIEVTRRFDTRFTRLWERVAPRFDFAVVRDAAYLQWKYIAPPHVRYSVAAWPRGDEVAGYVVYRHVHEPRGRVTLLVDFLADPDDEDALRSLLSYVTRAAREADSDKIRAFCLHAGYRRTMKRSGFLEVKSTMDFVARVNAVPLPDDFYQRTDRWHVTLGDSDQDR